MLLKGTQGCDSKAVCILKFDSLPVGRFLQSYQIILFVNQKQCILTCPGHTSAMLKVKKGKWSSPTLSFSSLPESFFRDKRSPPVFVDR